MESGEAASAGTQDTASRFFVRRMFSADVEPVMAIAASLAEAPHWPTSAYQAALDTQATPRRIALVAEDRVSRTIAGLAVAALIPPQAELETIAIAAQAQRHGIGRRLLSALIEEMKAAAASEFVLEVRATNLAALGLYRSLGWRETGRRPRYYANPEEDAILMSLGLG